MISIKCLSDIFIFIMWDGTECCLIWNVCPSTLHFVSSTSHRNLTSWEIELSAISFYNDNINFLPGCFDNREENALFTLVWLLNKRYAFSIIHCISIVLFIQIHNKEDKKQRKISHFRFCNCPLCIRSFSNKIH